MDSLVIRAHLHEAAMVSDDALWFRLAIDDEVTNVMTYVVDTV